MNENTFKLAAIRCGDTIGYVHGDETVYREVVGWRDTPAGRCVLVGSDARQVYLDKVCERRRVVGCGAGTIVFTGS